MTNLQGLPAELWNMITIDLTTPDLCSLSKASSITYQRTLPALYTNVTLPIKFLCEVRGIPALRSLVLALIHSPGRGHMISTASLTLCIDSEWPGNCCRLPLGPHQLPWRESDYLAAEAMISSNSECFADANILTLRVREDHPDALVTLALSCMKNLRQLTLGEHFMASNSPCCAPMFVRMASSWQLRQQAPLFKHLETFHGCDNECGRGFWPNFDSMRALLYFPKLQTIKTALANPWDWCWPGDQPPQSSVKCLGLSNSEIAPKYLQRILEAMPNLEQLRLEVALPNRISWSPQQRRPEDLSSNFEAQYGSASNIHPDWLGVNNTTPAILDLTELVDAFQTVRSSLKVLSLRVKPFSYSSSVTRLDPEDFCTGNMLRMCKFPSLQTLDVPLTFLLFSHQDNITLDAIIPPNLEVIFLGDWDTECYSPTFSYHDIVDEFEDFLKIEVVPAGLKIALIDEPYNPSMEKEIAQFIAICREHSLKYSVHYEYTDNVLKPDDLIPWSPSWSSEKIDGLAALEKHWRKLIRLHERRGWSPPPYLKRYYGTLDKKVVTYPSDDDENYEIGDAVEPPASL